MAFIGILAGNSRYFTSDLLLAEAVVNEGALKAFQVST
jgi:hypothetical protein